MGNKNFKPKKIATIQIQDHENGLVHTMVLEKNLENNMVFTPTVNWTIKKTPEVEKFLKYVSRAIQFNELQK